MIIQFFNQTEPEPKFKSRNLVQCIPMFIWSMVYGSLLDRYHGATKLLFGIYLLGDIVSCSAILLGCIYYFESS